MPRDSRNAHHLATLSHAGRFWDAYLEIHEAERGLPARGRVAFSAAGDADPEPEPLRTADIFIEDSRERVLARAREFRQHQLIGLLRSCLPED